MASGKKITRLQRSKFMAALAEWGTREAACAVSGISHRQVARLIAEDAEFAEEFEEARQAALASMGIAVVKYGRDGWDEPVITGKGPVMVPDLDKPIDADGKLQLKVMTVRKRDPKLLLAALAALAPNQWGPFAGQQAPPLPADLQPDPKPTPDEPGPEKPIE